MVSISNHSKQFWVCVKYSGKYSTCYFRHGYCESYYFFDENLFTQLRPQVWLTLQIKIRGSMVYKILVPTSPVKLIKLKPDFVSFLKKAQTEQTSQNTLVAVQLYIDEKDTSLDSTVQRKKASCIWHQQGSNF